MPQHRQPTRYTAAGNRQPTIEPSSALERAQPLARFDIEASAGQGDPSKLHDKGGMQMLVSAKGRIERKLATSGRKGYASLANSDTELDELGDSFYDKQLRADGWHLDEVEDDELDFALPPNPTMHKTRCCCFGWF